MIAEVGGRILDTFAGNLAKRLEPELPTATEVPEAPVEPPEASEAEPIDLLSYAGSSVAKRFAPLIILGLLLLIFLSRRRRK
jgi:hypothetical protein